MEAARLGSSFLTFFGLVSLAWAFRLWNVVVRSGGVDGGRKEELAGGYGGRSWEAGVGAGCECGLCGYLQGGRSLIVLFEGCSPRQSTVENTRLWVAQAGRTSP